MHLLNQDFAVPKLELVFDLGRAIEVFCRADSSLVIIECSIGLLNVRLKLRAPCETEVEFNDLAVGTHMQWICKTNTKYPIQTPRTPSRKP